MSWGISPDFSGLSPCYRQIAYALLTRAPVAARSIATPAMPLDLHVLGLSLAFILSQDQTLRCISRFIFFFLPSKVSRPKLTSLFLPFVLHLLLSSLFNELYPRRPSPRRGHSFGESVAKLHSFPFSFQIFFNLFS